MSEKFTQLRNRNRDRDNRDFERRWHLFRWPVSQAIDDMDMERGILEGAGADDPGMF